MQEALTSRRTVYRYKREEVPDRILESAFDAASNAPCHKNTHPWKFYIMGEKTRESLIPEVEKLAKKKSIDGEEVGVGISKAMETPEGIRPDNQCKNRYSILKRHGLYSVRCSTLQMPLPTRAAVTATP